EVKRMAIRIEEQKPEIPVEIGELKFTFKVTDEAVLNFRKESLPPTEELEKIQAAEEDETNVEKVRELLRQGFDALRGEAADEQIYEMSPSGMVVSRYFTQLVLGSSDAIERMGADKALEKRAKKYLQR